MSGGSRYPLYDLTQRKITYRERAEFYEVEYAETNDQPFLNSLVTDGVRSILEVPCGAGRNVGWLANTGRPVVCADIEPSMVERLKERVRAEGAADRIRPVVADMRTLDLEATFDLILVPQEAFQLLTDRADALRALKALGRHLDRRSTLMIDLFSFAPDDRDDRSVYPGYFDPKMEDGRLVPEWTRSLPSGANLSRSRVQHHEDGTVRVEYFYSVTQAGVTLDRWRSEVRLKKYGPSAFRNLLQEANLEIKRAFRNYSREPYTPGAARMIALVGHRGMDG